MNSAGPESRVNDAKSQLTPELSSAGLMAGEVSHELNNMLTVVVGNGELLQHSLSGDPKLRNLADLIVAAGDRIAQLSANLLAFARLEAPKPLPSNINDVVLATLGSLTNSAGHGISIRTDLARDIWPVQIDARGLQLALSALCKNALEAMSQGRDAIRPSGDTLTIVTRNGLTLDAALHGLEADQYVEIIVSDTGTGMSDSTRHQAFDLFFTTKIPAEGRGLGLSLVHAFVQRSNGIVKMESDLGSGTSISLWLPVS